MKVEINQYKRGIGFNELMVSETMEFNYYFDNYLYDLMRYKDHYKQKLLNKGLFTEVIGQYLVHEVRLLEIEGGHKP